MYKRQVQEHLETQAGVMAVLGDDLWTGRLLRLSEFIRRTGLLTGLAFSLAAALSFFATAWVAGDAIAGSELGRALDANLTWLADPRTWLH